MVKASLKISAMGCLLVGLVAPAFGQDAGADIYKLKCAMCHGVDGTANTPAGKAFKAASFSDPAIVKISDADRAVVVKNGKGKMPVFGDKLTADQIKAALAYIRTLEK
jgi:mono/diheme cytochrome c family protein